MFELVLIGFAALATAALGVPVVNRLATAQLMGTSAPEQHRHRARPFETVPREPLDFGPIRMRWPSEVPRTRPPRPELQWPSASWEDDFFGNKAATDRAEAARVRADEAARAGRARMIRAEAPADAASAPAPTPKPSKKAQRKAKAAAAPATPDAPDLPDAAELEAMIRDLGLARTVRALMERTGWTLDQIADFVASRRR